MSSYSSLDDSDESLSDYKIGLNNVFSVDQLVAVDEQVAMEKEDEEEVSVTEFEKESYLSLTSSSSVDSSSFGGAALIANLHDANELSGLSTLTNSQTALSAASPIAASHASASQTDLESAVEELDDKEEEANEIIEEEYASDFESSEECEEQIDKTTTTSYSSSTLQENNSTEEEIEDLSERQTDHLNTCSVCVQTDPIPPQMTHTREATRTITCSCPNTHDPECLVQDMLYSQLELTRQLMEQSLQLARSLTTTVTPSYHYTTLQETKQVCLCTKL